MNYLRTIHAQFISRERVSAQTKIVRDDSITASTRAGGIFKWKTVVTDEAKKILTEFSGASIRRVNAKEVL